MIVSRRRRRSTVYAAVSPSVREYYATFLVAKVTFLSSSGHCMYVCVAITYSKGKDQPGKVVNPARGQLNREELYSLFPFAPENLVSQDGFGSPVPRQPAHLHTQGESVLTCGIPPEFCGDVYLFISPVLSTCPPHTYSGCGKERRILIGPWSSAKAALVRDYLEVYWPCAGGLSAVNAIGTQLRDPLNSGLTR